MKIKALERFDPYGLIWIQPIIMEISAFIGSPKIIRGSTVFFLICVAACRYRSKSKGDSYIDFFKWGGLGLVVSMSMVILFVVVYSFLQGW